MKLSSSIVIASLLGEASSFTPHASLQNMNFLSRMDTSNINSSMQLNAVNPSNEQPNNTNTNTNRREIINTLTTSGLAIAAASLFPNQANALVEGNPAPTNKSASPKKKALSEEYMQGTSALANMDSNAAVPESAYKKLPSGVVYADIRQGNGDVEIGQGSRVNLQWVLRKSNGYFVDSSEVQDGIPFIFTTGDKTAIDGLDEGVRGMRQGGTRRLLIPPSLAYAKGLDDGCPGPLPAGFGPRQQMRRVQGVRKDVPGEYVFLELMVTRVR